MPIGITWCTLDEAASKYCLEKSLILEWVEQGLVRAETAGHKVLRVNVDDLELKVQEKTGI